LRFKAQTLGHHLLLTREERYEAQITTIRAFDTSPDKEEAWRKLKRSWYDRGRRRAAGMVPRAEYEARSLARTRPWEAFGISRSTWYRRGKPDPADRTLRGLPSQCEGSTGANGALTRVRTEQDNRYDIHNADLSQGRRSSLRAVQPLRPCSANAPRSGLSAAEPASMLFGDGVQISHRADPFEGMTREQIKRRRRKFFGSPAWHEAERMRAQLEKRAKDDCDDC